MSCSLNLEATNTIRCNTVQTNTGTHYLSKSALFEATSSHMNGVKWGGRCIDKVKKRMCCWWAGLRDHHLSMQSESEPKRLIMPKGYRVSTVCTSLTTLIQQHVTQQIYLCSGTVLRLQHCFQLAYFVFHTPQLIIFSKTQNETLS